MLYPSVIDSVICWYYPSDPVGPWCISYPSRPAYKYVFCISIFPRTTFQWGVANSTDVLTIKRHHQILIQAFTVVPLFRRCACVCVWVRVYVCAFVCACVRTCVCVCVHFFRKWAVWDWLTDGNPPPNLKYPSSLPLRRSLLPSPPLSLIYSAILWVWSVASLSL